MCPFLIILKYKYIFKYKYLEYFLTILKYKVSDVKIANLTNVLKILIIPWAWVCILYTYKTMPYKKVKVMSYKPDIVHVSCAFECFFYWLSCSKHIRRVWRYQRGNQKPYIEEE